MACLQYRKNKNGRINYLNGEADFRVVERRWPKISRTNLSEIRKIWRLRLTCVSFNRYGANLINVKYYQNNMVTKVIEVHLPEYHIKEKPEYLKIGRKVDEILESSFPDGKYIIRAISSQDHPRCSINELVKIILKLGTDRYDPNRMAVAHEEFCEYDYDIQASTFEIKGGKIVPNKEDKYPSIFGSIIYNFYENTLGDRGYSVRIDLLLVYDINKLKKAEKVNFNIKRDRPGWDLYLYKFKNQEKKKNALLGIVKIL